MKLILVLALVMSVSCVEYYNSKYDNFNAQDLVNNLRLLKSYAKCFLDKGPCTSAGKDFKVIIPEALRTSCGRCSPKQRKLVRVVVRGLQEHLPEYWTELVNHHDPEGNYKAAFNKFLNAED